jgi:N-acetyltransferase
MTQKGIRAFLVSGGPRGAPLGAAATDPQPRPRAEREATPAAHQFSRKRALPSDAARPSAAPPATGAAAAAPPPPLPLAAAAAPAAAPAPAPAPRAARSAALTQLHLDLGQRDFHAARCGACGMVFARGDPCDERLHTAHHVAALRGPRYAAAAGDRAVGADGVRGRVVLVEAPGGSAPPRRVAELAALLEAQLGIAEGWLTAVPLSLFLYVCAATKRVIGVAAVERIRTARPVAPAAGGGGADAGGEVRFDAAAAPRRAACGVRVVWTVAEARRRGVASRLLDAARAQVTRGCVAPRGEVAFAQPTAAGAALARTYTGASDFLAY